MLKCVFIFVPLFIFSSLRSFFFYILPFLDTRHLASAPFSPAVTGTSSPSVGRIKFDLISHLILSVENLQVSARTDNY